MVCNVFSVPTSDERSFSSIIKRDIQLICSVMKMFSVNPSGELALNYTLQLPQGSVRLFSHLVLEYKGDHKKTAEWMT